MRGQSGLGRQENTAITNTAMTKQESPLLTLNNGVQMPALGLGARYLEPFTLAIAQLAYEGDEGPELAYRIERFGTLRSNRRAGEQRRQLLRRLLRGTDA